MALTTASPERTPNWFARAWDSDIGHSFRTSPVTMLAAFVVLVIALAALFAPWIAPTDPFDPASLNLMDGKTPPLTPSAFTGNEFLLGTDDQGRDVFSAILYGARMSLLVGLASVAVSIGLGVGLGLLAGYRGGWLDSLIMRVADIQLTFPDILVAMLIFGVARGAVPVTAQESIAIPVLILSIGVSKWPQYARTVRGLTLVERGKDYVAAARVVGLPQATIMRRHILPNVIGPVLVIATLGLSLAIITEATLSFLGVGAPPTQPSLGTLIRIGQEYIASGEWWILFFPAITLLAIALSVNLLGDWLRDALNPRLRG
ncbi:peptide/nickel transport system permease protein [Azorhizobium sp. AG788]|uniref:ABC transporter permease n=1 Tax=Azorhizobium sp. AG788 TaxID=2183897 RepID=UPI00105EDE0D|nr:ABC transporter permease [Azorhizobium sp. AG788]TDT99186.1 peptide/nickel transport system permease protein [Azorhizobium sp. AG788]